MNKLSIIAVFVGAAAISSCSDVKRTPGKVYMPDMAYSRAVETYNDHRELQEVGINYNAMPVAGTVARGEDVIYKMLKDTAGGYVVSSALKNPLPALSAEEYTEAERVYLINCGICHGPKLDGNGPLYKDGAGPYPAKPATLKGDPVYEAMSDGTMFYSITYGKNLMGPYASQLTPKQRWMVVHYIRMQQKGVTPDGAGAASDSTATATTDTTAAVAAVTN